MKIYYLKISLYCLFMASAVYAQKQININNLSTDYVLSKNADKRKLVLIKKINSLFSKDINEVDQKELADLLYDINISCTSTDSIDQNILLLLNNWDLLAPKLKYAVLEYVSANPKDKFSTPLQKIVDQESDASFSVQATILLSLNKNDKLLINNLSAKFESKNFSGRSKDLLLFFKEELSDSIPKPPPIKDLLNHNFQKGKTIIYSFHRKNRIYPGATIIKDPEGKFLRNSDSSLFSIPQLAYSVSNMPWFITNGNTPQGIYSIVGWYISSTESIGPTPIVLTRIPFEKPPATFFHGNNSYNSWNINDYKNLLPLSWRKYKPIYQSFYAGKLGRRLIVMHGSADDLNDYIGKPFYPLTPTRGCLSAKEIWSETTGECLESDQVKLMNAFLSTEQLKGFLVVIEIDDKNEPIKPDEIEKLIEGRK